MQLIISDLHLDPSRPATANAFLEFLSQRATQASCLYILGDLFELWIGDDDDNEFNQRIKTGLRDLKQAGTETFFIRGNRDFLVGEQFAQDTGIEILPDSFAITFNDKPCLLMHGDTLCTDDLEYQQFRQQVRSADWQTMVLNKSLQERRELGKQLRQQSKTMSSRKSSDIMDVSDATVKSVMDECGAQILIHGHTHRPNIHEVELDSGIGKRIVLGDWDELAWCIEINDEGIELKSWAVSD